MIAGTGSGCGKTTVTCSILQALVNRGMAVSALKCGPDYIDPMFHSRIIGADTGTLDSFFCGKEQLRTLLGRREGTLSIIEGVMGLYDGAGETGSSYQVACMTETPVILVIDCKGMAASIGAVLQGFLQFRMPNPIVGVICNRLPERLIPMAEQFCTAYGVQYFGRLPAAKDCTIGSRHLGLVTAGEIADLKEKMNRLAHLCEQHIHLDAVIEAAQAAIPLADPAQKQAQQSSQTVAGGSAREKGIPQKQAQQSSQTVAGGIGTGSEEVPAALGRGLRIGIAKDAAFCFYYAENLELLRTLGCELVFFSPLNDAHLPKRLHGLWLGGGYPELYAAQLSDNGSMRQEIWEAIADGMPVIAECGGFLYLHETLEDTEGGKFQMAGVLNGHGYRTERLQRFGYVKLTAKNDNLLCKAGESFPAHEFHYYESTNCGTDLHAEKYSSGERYDCVYATERMYGGFPHLYLYACPEMAERFIQTCRSYQKEKE